MTSSKKSRSSLSTEELYLKPYLTKPTSWMALIISWGQGIGSLEIWAMIITTLTRITDFTALLVVDTSISLMTLRVVIIAKISFARDVPLSLERELDGKITTALTVFASSLSASFVGSMRIGIILRLCSVIVTFAILAMIRSVISALLDGGGKLDVINSSVKAVNKIPTLRLSLMMIVSYLSSDLSNKLSPIKLKLLFQGDTYL